MRRMVNPSATRSRNRTADVAAVRRAFASTPSRPLTAIPATIPTGAYASPYLTVALPQLSDPSQTRALARPGWLGDDLLPKITRAIGRGERVGPCRKQPKLGTEGLAGLGFERCED